MNAEKVSAGNALARWILHMGSRWALVLIALAVVYGFVRVGREIVAAFAHAFGLE